MSVLFDNILKKRRIKKGSIEFFIRESLNRKERYEVEVVDGYKQLYCQSNLTSNKAKEVYEKFM